MTPTPARIPDKGAYVRWTSPLDPTSWLEGLIINKTAYEDLSFVTLQLRQVSGTMTLRGARAGQSWDVVFGAPADLARNLRVIALYDGLTVEECLRYWELNKLKIDQGRALVRGLTRAQVAVGRAAWQGRYGPIWSATLRLQVEASEAERRALKVSVVLPDPDLETANVPVPTQGEVYHYHCRQGPAVTREGNKQGH